MRRPRRLQRPYSIIYLVLGLLVTGVELFGVFQSERGDTISEHYWWVAEHTGGAAHLVAVGFLGWLAYHFLFQGKRSRRKSGES